MKRILLVDDDEHTRLFCRRWLLRQGVGGVEVHEAATGEEALALLGRSSFDCILTDYRMGAVTGIDVLAAALERQPEAGRVLMSGFADEALLEGARRRARIHDFIEKPIASLEFERLLQRSAVERFCRAG